MQCTQCGLSNPPGISLCTQCSTPLPLDDRTIGNPFPDSDASRDANQTLTHGWSEPAEPIAQTVSSERLRPGQVLGNRYQILQLLGEGGMGAVYKARDTELDRIVALKLIRPEFAKNPEILRRFKQEMILARQITHKNVIRIFDLGQADGIKFITMDFVEGRDLRQLLAEKGKLAPEQAARIMLQICRALEAAHGEGVVHRDLKPQNIMLDASGRVYVMDFGIARSDYLPGMTQTGALIGTPEYMSPEQAKGEKIDERSDLFSLGVILYELMIGQSPYYSETPLATLWKRIQEKAKSLSEVDATIPKPLSDIVAKALEIEPENRFANAGEFAQHLEVWLGISPSMIGSITDQALAPLRVQKPIWKYTAIGAIVVLLAVAVVGFPKK